ncbi:MAG TPA: PAS domain S-box protein [Chthoniobacterales bacterium]|jgi:PAS domain S-box-containing protein|nr:PAS domain S-box protein [Chthoniobacterales bacterium]
MFEVVKNALAVKVAADAPELSAQDDCARRSDELFEQQQQEIYRNTDQLFARLMIVQWIAAVAMALLISPYTWVGQSSAIHIHVWAAIFLGGAISFFPIWLTRAWPGAAITRYVIAVGQMLMSALLISVTGGRIETHFHVFGSLVILSFYRDWRVLIPATIVVALDHFLRGVYWPYSVYGVLTASPWRSIEHAAWVIFEDLFLVISCLRSIREMRSIANRTAALEASEQTFRQIFEDGPMGVAVVDLQQHFVKVNTSLCHMLGSSAEELIGKSTLEITYPDDVEHDNEVVDELRAGAVRSAFEKRYVRKDGELVWVNLTAAIIRNKEGQPHHYVTMVKDVTERKHAEETLQERTRQLESAVTENQVIMDNSLDVICTVDEEGRFLTVNAACEQLWGYTPAELIGRKYIELVAPDDRERTIATEATLKKTGKLTDFVNRYIRKDGTFVAVLWSATWSESAKTFFGIAHDVTERAKMEKALEGAKDEADRANRAKSEFLSRMSHELRTPLNAILGFGQLLERQNPTPTQRTRVQHVINAGRHLLGLINEVLDISRIEVGRMQLSLEPVCVAEAIQETLDLMRPLAGERRIQLIADVDLDATVHVLADRQRFKQVLLNLLTNGVKYTPVSGRVTVSCAANGSDKLRIRVADTGPGIAKEKLARLFTPFDRLGAELSNVEGTGLGLALSQRLIQAMGGAIGVENSCAYGSTFWVELPRTKSPLEQTRPPKERDRKHRRRVEGKKRTLLYIEDNLSNLTLIEQILEERSEIELLSAMQGQVGLDLARQHLPDLILLDLHLPDLPGWEVLSQLKTGETTSDIPVVVISADATTRQIKRLMKAGAVSYLTKPLDVVEFFRVLDQTAPATNGANKPPTPDLAVIDSTV